LHDDSSCVKGPSRWHPDGRPPGHRTLREPRGPPDVLEVRNGSQTIIGSLYVAVTFAPRVVRIPINDDGTAGVPETVVAPPAFMAAGISCLNLSQLCLSGRSAQDRTIAVSDWNAAGWKWLGGRDSNPDNVVQSAVHGFT
jgi:hypothetical protein